MQVIELFTHLKIGYTLLFQLYFQNTVFIFLENAVQEQLQIVDSNTREFISIGELSKSITEWVFQEAEIG